MNIVNRRSHNYLVRVEAQQQFISVDCCQASAAPVLQFPHSEESTDNWNAANLCFPPPLPHLQLFVSIYPGPLETRLRSLQIITNYSVHLRFVPRLYKGSLKMYLWMLVAVSLRWCSFPHLRHHRLTGMWAQSTARTFVCWPSCSWTTKPSTMMWNLSSSTSSPRTTAKVATSSATSPRYYPVTM